MRVDLRQALGFALLRLAMLSAVSILGLILLELLRYGLPALSWNFLVLSPLNGMTEGGIFPAIMGTFYVTLLTAIFSVPLGVFAAIYLAEYARETRLTGIIRIALRTLAGVPSIVYGLFGVALFVQTLGLGTSLLSSGLTLGLLTLPVTVTASEEAIKSMQQTYREAGYALGGSHWQVIRTLVFPNALPGILTGAILAISRAAGEVAPILFTGVAFFLPVLPDSVFSQFMALPYHLYILATQHQAADTVRPLAYATALVLLLLIMVLNITAIIIRNRFRNRIARMGGS